MPSPPLNPTKDPTKFLLILKSNEMVNEVLNENNPLWGIFNEIHPWYCGELLDDRLVWLECYGIPPLLWCKENLKTIGEK